MPNDIDLSTEALVKHRAIAENAIPGPWKVFGRWTCQVVTAYTPQEMRTDGCGSKNDFIFYLDDTEHRVYKAANDSKNTATHIAANSPDVVKAHIDEILRLRAEVERLNKEADYLAGVIAAAYCAQENVTLCEKTEGLPLYKVRDACAPCWREGARKAVEKQCQK